MVTLESLKELKVNMDIGYGLKLWHVLLESLKELKVLVRLRREFVSGLLILNP